MDKAKLIKEVESIWEEMGCSWDEGYSISGHTLNKIVSRAYDNVSEKSSVISPIIIAEQSEATVCDQCGSSSVLSIGNDHKCEWCGHGWQTG